MFLIKEASKLSGLSVRTLHHYDNIGLLSPQKSNNGYRYYSDNDMDTLQQILFYKYLGFSLKKIKDILESSDSDKKISLTQQLHMLNNEKIKINQLIETLENTINSLEGGKKMSIQEKFKGFTLEDRKKYRQEAIEKYGEEMILESELRQKGKEQDINDSFNQIFLQLAQNLKKQISIEDPSTQKLIKEIYDSINKYSFDCSLEVFESIGKGYVADQRFKDNIDKFAIGLAQYTRDAIFYFVKNVQ